MARDSPRGPTPTATTAGTPPPTPPPPAAYAQLRTPWGRSEALADLAAVPHVPPAAPAAARPARPRCAGSPILPARVRHGRPLRLAARAVIAAAVALLALAVIPGTPSAPAIVAGCALWLAFTAPRRPRPAARPMTANAKGKRAAIYAERRNGGHATGAKSSAPRQPSQRGPMSKPRPTPKDRAIGSGEDCAHPTPGPHAGRPEPVKYKAI